MLSNSNNKQTWHLLSSLVSLSLLLLLIIVAVPFDDSIPFDLIPFDLIPFDSLPFDSIPFKDQLTIER